MKTDQTVGLHCLSRPFWQAISVEKFRTFTVIILPILIQSTKKDSSSKGNLLVISELFSLFSVCKTQNNSQPR